MQPINHPLAPEELMAYLDGELPAAQAVGAASHLEQCAECRNLADALRSVSQTLAVWEVEPSGLRAPQEAMPSPALPRVRRKWLGLPRWSFGVAGVGAVLVVLGLAVRFRVPNGRLVAERGGTFMLSTPLPAARARAYDSESNIIMNGAGVSTPMIARTAQLQLTTRDFDHIRARLDDILKRHKGYFGEVNISTPTDAGRSLNGKLRIPSTDLDAALSDIRQLGHVDTESQSGEDVTQSFTDLEARLANSRHTEQRMVDLLRDRAGKLSDVLEAERELGRVRGEIEQMEAERRGILKRVDYATLTLTVNEEYKAQLHTDGSTATQFRNAAVDGFRSMAGSLVGVALFLLSSGPVLLLWAAILFFPARFAWRRWKRRAS